MISRIIALVLGTGLLACAPASAAEPVIEVTSHRTAFSPNGDGHRDVLPLRFRLTERARVTVRIAGVGATDLGTRGPGVHRWRWDGRGAADGAYPIRLVARTAPGEVDVARWTAVVDRGAEIAAVEIRLNRRTLYPATPGKHDEIWMHSTHSGNATELAVLDADGEVVAEHRFRQWGSWDGDGLPPGEYTFRFFVHDSAGNRRFLRRPVTISTEHLHQETWTSTVDAADADLFPSSCGLSPSTRYPDGLAVAPTGPSCDWAFLVPRFPIPVPVDPDVTFRLSITGAGDPAEVYISDGIDVVPTPTPVEGTTTTPWGSPSYVEWAREAEPAGWVIVREGSYDVAEMTLEVRYWTTSASAAHPAASASAPRGPGPIPATAPSR